MVRQRFNKYERKEIRAQLLEQRLHGEGLYIYQNANNGELTLPRPTASGVRRVPAGGQFQGDNYYMGMVQSHDLRLVQELVSPEAERKAKEMENKLILDQPDIVKAEGTVEHVQVPAAQPKRQKLHDHTQPAKAAPDVLLTEDPMAGVEIVMD